MMIKKILNTFWVLAVLAFVSSCGNDNEDPAAQPTADDIANVQDLAAAQAAFADATSMSSQAFGDQGSTGGRILQCFNTSEGEGNALVLSFDGTCSDTFGVTRSGDIIFSATGNLFEEGFQFNITFDNYSRDDYTLNGTISTGGWAFNDNGNLTYSYSITSGELEFPDGSVFKLNRTLNFESKEGIGTSDIFDDVYHVTGSDNGVNRNGVSYTADIDEPLIFKNECWTNNVFIPVGGTIKLNVEGRPEINVAFGDGACDKEGTISIGSFSQSITF